MQTVVGSRVLVVGGCGFIGSFTVNELCAHGHDVVVLDDLSAGSTDFLPKHVPLIRMDLTSQAALIERLSHFQIQSVIFLSGLHSVIESVRSPELYVERNFHDLQRMIGACRALGVREFIFASSSLVYANGSSAARREDDPRGARVPYGISKILAEQALEAAAADFALRVGLLRYFNVAGAHPAGLFGRVNRSTPHLIKVISQVAAGVRADIELFDAAVDTSDGTPIRDYVHVIDVARANRLTLEYLRGCAGAIALPMNIGSGHGSSILEVIAAAEAVTGQRIALRRGTSDVIVEPKLIANVQRAFEILGWMPQFTLQDILCHAYRWELEYQRLTNRLAHQTTRSSAS